MEHLIVDNRSHRLLDSLLGFISQAAEVKLAVAFARLSGWTLLADAISSCLESGGRIEFLLGLDFRTTEPDVLLEIEKMAMADKHVSLYCYSDPSLGRTANYHPKLYFLKNSEQALISIGSSNLSAGGLRDNVEMNLVITAEAKEEIVSEVHSAYNALKFQKGLFSPDIKYIREYGTAYRTALHFAAEMAGDPHLGQRIKGLRDKENCLPQPARTSADLFGWQRIVYDRLPRREFSTREIYSFEEDFRRAYPENRHVRAKVRQVLQQLRDMRFLTQTKRGRWIVAPKS